MITLFGAMPFATPFFATTVASRERGRGGPAVRRRVRTRSAAGGGGGGTDRPEAGPEAGEAALAANGVEAGGAGVARTGAARRNVKSWGGAAGDDGLAGAKGRVAGALATGRGGPARGGVLFAFALTSRPHRNARASPDLVDLMGDRGSPGTESAPRSLTEHPSFRRERD